MSARLEREVCSHELPLSGATRIREATFEDFEAVTDLKRRWGIVADPLENWERLWRRNPALAEMKCSLAIGWVLESDGKLVGYLGNIPLLYRYGDRRLLAVAGSGLVLEPRYRLFAVNLMSAFFRQSGADLYLTTTAIEAVGKMARAFRSDPLPELGYHTALFWVLQAGPFAEAVTRTLGLQKPISHAANMLTAAALRTDGMVRRRRPKAVSSRLAVSEIAVEEIGDEFQALWLDKLNEATCLYADRSAAALRWHFDVPGYKGSTRVLCCREDGVLVGYAVIRNDPAREDGLRRSVVADILAKRDDAQILRALLSAGYEHAKVSGSHVFEVRGLPRNSQQLCIPWKPYLREYPACPFYYKARDPILHKALAANGAWYASLFDGDTTLMP